MFSVTRSEPELMTHTISPGVRSNWIVVRVTHSLSTYR